MIATNLNSYSGTNIYPINNANVNLDKSQDKNINESIKVDMPSPPISLISDYQNSGNFIAYKISQQLNNSPVINLQLNLSGYGIGG
ncbi:MAG: hypothetical protein IPK14_20565 [Blastocatellia bacterium]|nr:hypothetical protein [Blastocatellia bacterium]MBL8193184.1 hypothetical protein [Blastocatellia bacterium]MBN8722176.1 hypothetical protein [Acidobacteriota bacterium]